MQRSAGRRATDGGYRIAAIDIGTNSIHMIIAEGQRHGYRVIDKEKEMVQLGLDSLEGRPLTAGAIERGVTSLRTMAEIARRWRADDVIAVATSAIREAPNRREFLSRVQREARVKVRVISGEEEADYIYRAVRAAVDFHGGTALLVDIGGGSVELIVATTTEVFFTRSLPLGALRIAQRFDLEAEVTAERLKECRAFVRKAVKEIKEPIGELGFDFAVGTSGTIVTLATIAAERGSNGTSVTAGLQWLSKTRLDELISELAPLNAAARAKTFDIDAKRAETILAGAIVLREVMSAAGTDQIRACDAALREGIVESRLATVKQRDHAAEGSVRRTSVLALAEQTHIQLPHAEHVAELALRIFDQTEELHRLQTGERELLEYAALLHEAGMHVSYQRHHKHSYYLISHAGLRGFTADQVAIIANVARYHRKSAPKEEDGNLAHLSAAQRTVVQKLTAILRVADSLDRGRHGTVRDIAVKVTPKNVKFTIRPRGDVELEREAAEKKARFFSRVFERKVTFDISAVIR